MPPAETISAHTGRSSADTNERIDELLAPGGLLGYWTSYLITQALASETFRVPFVADSRTYVIAAAIILFAALCSTIAESISARKRSAAASSSVTMESVWAEPYLAI